MTRNKPLHGRPLRRHEVTPAADTALPDAASLLWDQVEVAALADFNNLLPGTLGPPAQALNLPLLTLAGSRHLALNRNTQTVEHPGPVCGTWRDSLFSKNAQGHQRRTG